MQERDFKGVWIPKEIWLNKELSMIDKGILTEIASLDNENHCYATNEYFVEFCQVSLSTVTRSIKKLIDMHYIEVVTFNGRNRVIKLTMQGSQNDYADSSKCNASNIYNNTEKEKTSNNKLLDVENPPKKPKQNLYQKCYSEIETFTDDTEIKELLVTYLKIRLEIKDKPLYVNQWKGMLNKLRLHSNSSKSEAIKIIQQSIDRGYLSFYEVDNKYLKKNNVLDQAWNKNVKCQSMTEEEKAAQEAEWDKLREQGVQVDF